MYSSFKWARVTFFSMIIIFILSGAVFPIAPLGQGPPVENCAMTPIQLMGQAHGISIGAAGESEETINDEDIIADPAWILDALPVTGSGSEEVVILVVDEFPPNERAGGDKKPDTHGELVWEVLEMGLAQLQGRGINNIRLEQVNVGAGASGNYRTSTFSRDVGKAVDDLRKEGVRRIVINMSFVLVPCDDGDFSHAQFINDHRADPAKSVVNTLGQDATLELLRKPKEGLDPLHELLRDLTSMNSAGDFAVIPVAAAGNFGEPEPFFPAGWPEVIAVSASEGRMSHAEIWQYSNSGSIMTPGAWYLFEDGVYRAGTSFASPVMSLVAALYLSHETAACTFSSDAAPLNILDSFDNLSFSEGLNCQMP